MTDKYNPSNINMLSAAEAVRKRADLYFGDCFKSNSLDELPIEATCHAIDEILDGNCKWLKILVNSDFFEIQYDVGMPLLTRTENEEITAAEMIMTMQFACKNLKKHIHVGDELCKAGIASVNFTAEWCELNTVWQNKRGRFVFKEGETTSRELGEVEDIDMTSLKIRPDKSIFGDMWFSYEGVTQEAKRLSNRFADANIEVLRV